MRRPQAVEQTGEAGSSTLFEDLPLMVFRLDVEGVVVAVTEQGARDLGYRSDQLVGRSIRELVHLSDVADFESRLARTLDRRGEVARSELRMLRKDGSELWLRESVRAISAGGGSFEILVVCEDVSECRAAVRRLADARDQLRDLNAELSRVAEREDRRLSRILHDEVGNNLAAMRLALCQLRDSETAAGRSRRLGKLLQMLDQSIEATRSLSTRLSPPILYDQGLAPALQELGRKIEQEHGIAFQFQLRQGWSPPPRDTGVLLYQVVRELLHNVVKHADANTVWLDLAGIQGGIWLVFGDDGVGFNTSAMATSGGLGLFHARERLERLGGKLDVDSAPGHGTWIHLTLPATAARGAAWPPHVRR